MWPFDIFSRKKKYTSKGFTYYSERYGKSITVPKGFKTDGATGVPDLAQEAWEVHDFIFSGGGFDDGTYPTNWQASNIYCDILTEKGFPIRGQIRKYGTGKLSGLFFSKNLKNKS